MKQIACQNNTYLYVKLFFQLYIYLHIWYFGKYTIQLNLVIPVKSSKTNSDTTKHIHDVSELYFFLIITEYSYLNSFVQRDSPFGLLIVTFQI